MNTQGHTSDKLLAMELRTVVLLARVLLPSIVLVIVELPGTRVSHDIIWQTVLLLHCTAWAQQPGLQVLLRCHLARGKAPEPHSVLSDVAMACSGTHAYG